MHDIAHAPKNGLSKALPQSRVKVLLVEDDAASLQALGEALRLCGDGVSADTADSAQAALDQMARTDYDVVVSDIKIPGMDDLALLARSRKLRRHTPTLLVTWHDEHDLAAQALRGGAYDFIHKPITPEYFLAALERALELRRLDRQVEEQKQALERHARVLEQTVEELRRQTALVQLLQDITGAANQALTLEGALRTCLERVCAHTGWPVGHAYFPAADAPGHWVSAPCWHLTDPDRFASFRQATEAARFAPGAGLPGRVAATGKPVWIAEVSADPDFQRAHPARDAGVRAAFAFPVLVGTEVAAVLEFFAAEAVEPDARFLEAMVHIGTQLGQVLERVRAKEALEESEARFRRVAQSASDAIVSADSWGNIVFWNKGARIIFGYDEDEVLGKPLTLLMPEPYRDAHQRGLERLRTTGESKLLGKTVELHGLRKNGEQFPLELSLASWETAQGTFYTGILRDTSERKRAEENTRRLNDELARRVAEVEAANGELEAFSYSVSHDLRAPLRAVNGFARILLEDCAPHLPDETRRYLHLVRDNAQRMGQLIDDLLTFSRLSRQPLQKQPVATGELVRQALSDLRDEQEGRRVEIVVGDLPVCQADPNLLRQVFANLLSNALKYTRPREVALIEVGSRDDGGQPGPCVYYVNDNGVGFDMQYVHKLFGVFQRLHRAEDYEGTGVGLAIVQRIVRRHGGRVWAEAQVNHGATFYFTLQGDAAHD